LQAFQLADIIFVNQFIYLVAHHFTGFDYNILEEKTNEIRQKLSFCSNAWFRCHSQCLGWGNTDSTCTGAITPCNSNHNR